MNICPICQKEHDGSYGSGKFCSKHCSHVYVGKQTKRHVCNWPIPRTKKPWGTWKCVHCEQIFETKKLMLEHIKAEHSRKDGRIWNYGLTKETSESVRKFCKTVRKKFESGELVSSFKGKHQTDEAIAKMMKTYAENYKDMKYRGFYKGYYFEYSYELAWIVYNLEHNIPFKRCEQSFEYIASKDHKRHLYFPDFELNDGTIVEIKGHVTDIVFEKLNAAKNAGKKIIMLTKDELKPYIQYCKNKYGKDYLKKLKNKN